MSAMADPTNDPFTASPETLVQLRNSVEDWLGIARDALFTFSYSDGSFHLDNGKFRKKESDYRLHPTATARSYIALAAADRWLSSASVEPPKWVMKFETLYNKKSNRRKLQLFDLDPPSDRRTNQKFLDSWTDEEEHKKMNNFDIAHLADYIFVHKYISRFYKTVSLPSANRIFSPKNQSIEKLQQTIVKNLRSASEHSGRGKVPLEINHNEDDSAHFFVTLHSLRAISQLAPYSANLESVSKDEIKKICGYAEEFCITQSFYSSRTGRHQLDIVSLVFALLIYVLYSHHVDKDLCDACIAAIARAQQSNGSWPATHPIIRKKNREPWHITSHEVALCLTWLYFQPSVPDSGRSTLLATMEKYFSRWVIPTFTLGQLQDGNNSVVRGWFDDHTIGRDTVMGWATAIVCHFLSNYYRVLSDHINRRVIEATNLAASSRHYLIDQDRHEASPRWFSDVKKSPWAQDGRVSSWAQASIANWPDLPPVAWSANGVPGDLEEWLRWKWTDPSKEGSKDSISNNIVEKVLGPIFSKPGERPGRSVSAGVLPGDPGTRKTTLVNALAELLCWPMVGVPPSVIFESGFDSLEARANEVFRRLSYLRGCVIFFDEFEELLRDRSGQEGTIHDRTIAAFMTSSMLPRLQELNDQQRCLIFLATNHLGRIDEAILRPGRFDFLIEISHPQRDRIEEYLQGDLTLKTCEMLGFQPDEPTEREPKNRTELSKVTEPVLAAVTEIFGENEKVRFAWVEKALKAASQAVGDKNEKKQSAAKSFRRSLKWSAGAQPPPLSELEF